MSLLVYAFVQKEERNKEKRKRRKYK